ncbi:MAG: hypothetical protein O8C66_07510 [Candidatus Methanoperedens sp.]|nr:hypothetical protein [Candidatus Methanoperedens sp.]MCZ7370341.1 hypothetical protein [Candidatus Methanoperedens sp.]
MYTSSRQLNPLIGSCIDPAGFKPACITVIEGTSTLVTDTLFGLCALKACGGHDVILVDGANSFDPYAVSRSVKLLGQDTRSALSRIHVARAFTEYQMDAIICGLHDAALRWPPSLVAVLYLSNLFSTEDGKRLFDPLLKNLRDVTRSSGLVTVVTSFGGNWWGDRMLAGNADRVIRIEKTKTHVKVKDGGNVFMHVPVPPGQTKVTDFIGGETNGQNCAELSGAA